MEDLKKKFVKEPVGKQRIIIAGLAGVVASFLPWWSSVGYSRNGWSGYALITTIASLAIVLNWVLPKVGVKYKLPWKEDMMLKALSVAMLVGSALWMLTYYQQTAGLSSYIGFSFSTIGIGVYLSLVAGGVAAYYSFAKTSKAKK